MKKTKIKWVLIIILVVLMASLYLQHRFINAIPVCEQIGGKEAFYQKLYEAENDNNVTLGGILFIYYSHRCSDFTENEKEHIRKVIKSIGLNDQNLTKKGDCNLALIPANMRWNLYQTTCDLYKPNPIRISR